MKEMKMIYSNWRCVALIVFALCAFVLAIAESDSVAVLIVSKVCALVLVCICALLGRCWSAQGKINELLDVEE